MMGEDWAAVENIACRDMYFECVEELCHYLKTEEKFEELHSIAHRAAEIYPLYDWQVWEIDSLIGMSRYKEGLEVYKRTTKLMFEELGAVCTIWRDARAIQAHGRARTTGSGRDRRHQVPSPQKKIHRRRLLLHLSKLCGYLPRVWPHDGKNRHVRVSHALHSGFCKY